ncbi:MAG: hypothetical protein HRU09_13010 [Oligoflexales bacterium]|nr:hypothetical protein [Oligoflexales bacterium]
MSALLGTFSKIRNLRVWEAVMTMTSMDKLGKTKTQKVAEKIFLSHQSVFLCIAIGAFLIANTSFLVGEQLRFYQSAGLGFVWALIIAFFSEFSVVFMAAFGMATKKWFRRLLSFGVVTGLLLLNYYHPHTHALVDSLSFFGRASLSEIEPFLFDKLQILIMIWNLILGSLIGYLLRNIVRVNLIHTNLLR